MKRGGFIERRTPIERGEPLRAKRWGTRPAPKDPENWRLEYLAEWMTAEPPPKLTPYEKAFQAFVRTLPCIVCGRPGPSTASHITLSANEKGTGMKVNHLQVVPHCEDGGNGCHPQWEQRRGLFAGMTKEQRYAEGRAWVDGVHALLKVGDDKRHAYDLQAAKLGTVEEHEDGRWTWTPGDADEAKGRAA